MGKNTAKVENVTPAAAVENAATNTAKTNPLTKPSEFANEQKLLEHFEKHGNEFQAKSPSEYLAIGQETIDNGIHIKYEYKNEIRDGYVQYAGNRTKNGQSKFIFVGTNNDGNITTIHTESGKKFWKTINNNPKDKTIYPSK